MIYVLINYTSPFFYYLFYIGKNKAQTINMDMHERMDGSINRRLKP